MIEGAAVPRVDDELHEFCRAAHPSLVGAVGLFCGDVDVAEECAQEALLRACRDWDRVRTMDNPQAWLMTVACNLARSRYRHLASLRRTLARSSALRSQASTRDDDSGERADALAVRAAVASLPHRQRMALVLRYFGDLSVRETATSMGCSEGTVKALTSQAISGLRRAGLEVDDD